MELTSNGSSIELSEVFSLSEKPFDKWTEKQQLNLISSQYRQASDWITPKRANWVNYNRLYLNQYRKDGNPELMGSKLLFTKFNESYANFSSDTKRVEFQARSIDDISIVANTNKIATFDFEEFSGSRIFSEWDWDALFFGTGVLDVGEFDTKRNILLPRRVNPFLLYIDPIASCREDMRFAGTMYYSTLHDIKSYSDIDYDKVKASLTEGLKIKSNSSVEQIQSEQSRSILLNTRYFSEELSPTSLYEYFCWYLKVNGETYRVFVDTAFTNILAIKKLAYKDDGEGGSLIPFIFKNYYPIPSQILGIGIPDLIEDNHRSDVQLNNYFLDSARADSTTTMLFDWAKFVNPRDMYSREMNKNIPVKGDPSSAIVPFPKTQSINDASLSFKNQIQREADLAVGSSQILRGSLSEVSKTATEVVQAKAKQDLIMSARAKDMISAEKQFWNCWINRYRVLSPEKSTKFMRITGDKDGVEFSEIVKKDFVPTTDPDVIIESKLVSEPAKVLLRQDLVNTIPLLQQSGGDMREVARQALELMDKTEDEIAVLLPPTPDELLAKNENEKLCDDTFVPVIAEDDDVQHIAMHLRCEQTEARDKHILAHQISFLEKRGKATSEGQQKPSLDAQNSPQNAVNGANDTGAPQGDTTLVDLIKGQTGYTPQANANAYSLKDN